MGCINLYNVLVAHIRNPPIGFFAWSRWCMLELISFSFPFLAFLLYIMNAWINHPITHPHTHMILHHHPCLPLLFSDASLNAIKTDTFSMISLMVLDVGHVCMRWWYADHIHSTFGMLPWLGGWQADTILVILLETLRQRGRDAYNNKDDALHVNKLLPLPMLVSLPTFIKIDSKVDLVDIVQDWFGFLLDVLQFGERGAYLLPKTELFIGLFQRCWSWCPWFAIHGISQRTGVSIWNKAIVVRRMCRCRKASS